MSRHVIASRPGRIVLALLPRALPDRRCRWLLADQPFELRMADACVPVRDLGHGWNVLGGYGRADLDRTRPLSSGWAPMRRRSVGEVRRQSMAGTAGSHSGRGRAVACSSASPASGCAATTSSSPRWWWRSRRSRCSRCGTGWAARSASRFPCRREGLANFQFHRDKTAVLLHRARHARPGDRRRLVAAGDRAFGFLLRAVRDDETALRSLGFSPQTTSRSPWRSARPVLACGGHVPCAVRACSSIRSACLALHISILVALFAILGGSGTLFGPIRRRGGPGAAVRVFAHRLLRQRTQRRPAGLRLPDHGHRGIPARRPDSLSDRSLPRRGAATRRTRRVAARPFHLKAD